MALKSKEHSQATWPYEPPVMRKFALSLWLICLINSFINTGAWLQDSIYHNQGYRNFEIQTGPLDRWRHTNMRLTIPDSHEN